MFLAFHRAQRSKSSHACRFFFPPHMWHDGPKKHELFFFTKASRSDGQGLVWNWNWIPQWNCWWFVRNPGVAPVEGQVVEIPLFTRGFDEPSNRWLGMGFLNHQQNWVVVSNIKVSGTLSLPDAPDKWRQMVSNIFHFHPSLGKWSNLTI